MQGIVAHFGLVGVCLHILTSQQNHGSITASQIVAQKLGIGEQMVKVLSKTPIVPTKPVKVRAPERPADKDAAGPSTPKKTAADNKQKQR